MRVSTAILTSIVAASSLAASLQFAHSAREPALLPIASATAASNGVRQDAAGAAPGATDSALQATRSDPYPNDPAQVRPAPVVETEAPTQPGKNTPVAPTEAAAPVVEVITVTSDVISYKYGEVQISVTAQGADIIDAKVLVGDMSYGRDAAYAALIQATVISDGSNYGNVSGATFTSEAFRKAVENALNKL